MYHRCVMRQVGDASELAGALADPLRLMVLHRLLEGPAAVSELVSALGEPQPKVSNHLRVLRKRGLIESERRGRQHVYALADPAVGSLVESLLSLSGSSPTRDKRPALAQVRTCYDHLAGRAGVALLDGLIDRGALSPADADYGDIGLGPRAAEVFGAFNVDVDAAIRARRRLAYACLDWTERRHHLGGSLGAALCRAVLARGWLARRPRTRALRFTENGRKELAAWIDDPDLCTGSA